MNDRIKILEREVLSDDTFVLTKTTFDYRRGDGRWQRLSRESYDHGHGVAVLLYDKTRRSVVLVRQFRFAAYLGDGNGFLIEACAGLLDGSDPEARIRLEAEEETGYRLGRVDKLFELYMTPGTVTERLSFFRAEIDATAPRSGGGGLADEGEDIEVLEIAFDEALAMVANGAISDAKTVLLLQHAQLSGLFG